MNKEQFLGDRRRALESSFFSKQDEALIRRLREKEEAEARQRGLSEASGITDRAVLDELVRMQIGAETLAALSLVPLVAVAWADGVVEDKERASVLCAAEEVGIHSQDVSHELLETWLRDRPGPELLATWKEYIRALASTLDPVAKNALRRDLLGRARVVAQAAGGFLGLGNKISSEEEAVLQELEGAFS